MTDLITINKASPAPQSVLPSTFASQPSFTQKLLNFSISLAQNGGSAQPTSFPELSGLPGSGTINVSGARARCRIRNAGTPTGSQADIAIYGLSQSLMNSLATLGVVFDSVSQNTILVSAGAASNQDASALNANGSPLVGFPVVFGGTIWFAYADYNQMPEVPFRITAQGGLFQAVKSAAPSSFKGSTSVDSIFSQFAQQLGVPLENNGVSGSLSNPYFSGTVLQQVYQAAEHCRCQALLVDGGTKLALIPLGGSRTSQTNIPLISKDTGMIRSPSFANNGWLVVEMIYNPDVLFLGNVQIISDNVPQANRTWTVYNLSLALDTLTPGGQWKATALCRPQNYLAGPPPTVGSAG